MKIVFNQNSEENNSLEVINLIESDFVNHNGLDSEKADVEHD